MSDKNKNNQPKKVMILTAVILAAFFVLIFLLKQFCNFDNNGSIADWASGIGSIGAIIFVIIQIIESQKQLNKQLKNEKENAFRIERPLFKILLKSWLELRPMVMDKSKKIYIPLHGSSLTKLKDKFFLKEFQDYSDYSGLYIKNISDKSILAMECIIYVSDNNDNLTFKIDKMESSEEAILLLPDNIKNIENYRKNMKVIVYYNTVIREQIRLVFNINSEDRLEYSYDEKWMENKDGGWPQPNSEFTNLDYKYNLNDFEESEFFGV